MCSCLPKTGVQGCIPYVYDTGIIASFAAVPLRLLMWVGKFLLVAECMKHKYIVVEGSI